MMDDGHVVRGAAYSLFGTCLNGLNGLNLKIAEKVWKVYISPKINTWFGSYNIPST